MKKVLCIITILTFILSSFAYGSSNEHAGSMLPYKSWDNNNKLYPSWVEKPTSTMDLSGYESYDLYGFADRSTLYTDYLFTGCTSYKVRYENNMTETEDTFYIYELGTGLFGMDKKLLECDVDYQDYELKTINNVQGSNSEVYLKTKAPTDMTGYFKGNSN